MSINNDNIKQDIKDDIIKQDIKDEMLLQHPGHIIICQLGLAKYIHDNYNIDKIRLIMTSVDGSTIANSLLCNVELEEIYKSSLDIFTCDNTIKEIDKLLLNNCIYLIDNTVVISCETLSEVNTNNKIYDYKNINDLIESSGGELNKTTIQKDDILKLIYKYIDKDETILRNIKRKKNKFKYIFILFYFITFILIFILCLWISSYMLN